MKSVEPITREMTLLDLISDYPEKEEFFREIQEKTGVCILCNYLFSSLEEIGSIFQIPIEKWIREIYEYGQKK